MQQPCAKQNASYIKLLLDTHNTDAGAAVGARVLFEPNEEGQTKGRVEGGGHNSRLGHSQAGVGRSAVSSAGGEL